jgi:hypothetical protein
MTHYNVHYENMDSIETKAKALKDIQSYLGSREKYDELCKLFREDAGEQIPTLKQWRMILSFLGVQGS